MPYRIIGSNSAWMTAAYGVLSAFFVICMVLFPAQSFQASLSGLSIWWKIVFPAWLPFLIVSELLLGYGIVHFIGVLLEPPLRLLFRLPYGTGRTLAIGAVVGYPAAAGSACALRERLLITRDDGERLLAISHMASPVYIVLVVCVGFFGKPQLIPVMLTVHFASVVVLSVFLRFFGHPKTSIEPLANDGPTHRKLSLLVRAWEAMEEARRQDGRMLGKLLSDAVVTSIQTLMMIGGFIMIFSVITQVITLTGYSSSSFILPGLLEVNLGMHAIHSHSSASPKLDAAAASAFIAWSGLAVHAQIGSMMKQTDLRYSRFFLFKLIHSLLAFVLTYVIWQVL